MSGSVLAIDPGSRNLGYAVIDHGGPGLFRARAYGVLRYKGDAPFVERLLRIHEDVLELIQGHRPGLLAIEKAFVGESVQSAMKLGEARAAAIVAAGRQKIEITEITPAAAKKAVTGSGRASKVQVRGVVTAVLSLPGDLALDASDALCIGLACLYQRETGASLGAPIPQPKRRRGKRGGWSLEDIARLGLEVGD